MILTDVGETYFAKLEVSYKNRNKSQWINKEEKSIITKIDKDFIYLPNQSELSF